MFCDLHILNKDTVVLMVIYSRLDSGLNQQFCNDICLAQTTQSEMGRLLKCPGLIMGVGRKVAEGKFIQSETHRGPHI